MFAKNGNESLGAKSGLGPPETRQDTLTMCPREREVKSEVIESGKKEETEYWFLVYRHWAREKETRHELPLHAKTKEEAIKEGQAMRNDIKRSSTSEENHYRFHLIHKVLFDD